MFARLVRQYSTQLKNIKPPTAEVPDVSSFLTKIGRSMDQHAEHFENWESLIGTDGKKLKALGIDTRDRRYILAWVCSWVIINAQLGIGVFFSYHFICSLKIVAVQQIVDVVYVGKIVETTGYDVAVHMVDALTSKWSILNSDIQSVSLIVFFDRLGDDVYCLKHISDFIRAQLCEPRNVSLGAYQNVPR